MLFVSKMKIEGHSTHDHRACGEFYGATFFEGGLKLPFSLDEENEVIGEVDIHANNGGNSKGRGFHLCWLEEKHFKGKTTVGGEKRNRKSEIEFGLH